MKKLLLSATLLVAFSLTSFAGEKGANKAEVENYPFLKSQANQDLVGTCYVTISAYDEEGNKVKTWVLQFNNVESAEDCNQIGGMVEKALTSL
ncbi:hypothetical protein IWX83_000109 [Flavobacterium sp. CG_9.1]|uniref:hypothetical protein n=1 Tax=Flavobacterium sp. CG_9.1 TaxID=2787728 RepID=UPI0018C950BF|nr:hypothetical protein [Flavobacterium sp. CG_9.1]MBG6060346.1 hypothetical protein [Flavobacterium sp. CG_9.1]